MGNWRRPLSDQYRIVCETLERLRKEAESLLTSWAFFESSNGYPLGCRRNSLRQSIDDFYESVGIIQIQNMCARDSILTLHRMIDKSGDGGKSNRQSLTRVSRFLAAEGSLQLLVDKAKAWNPDFKLEAYNEQLVRTLFAEVEPWLSEGKSIRGIGPLRETISGFRNSELAHALDLENVRKVRLTEVRRGVTLTTALVKKCSLLVAGYDWDARGVWKHSLSNANQFWDRYEKGFQPQVHK